jgi:hypothetical protein
VELGTCPKVFRERPTLDLDCDPCLEERVGNVVTGVGVRLARSLEQGEAGWLLS